MTRAKKAPRAPTPAARPERRGPPQAEAPHGLRERLEAAEARYRALTEQLPMVVYTAALDVQGAFTFVSGRAEDLLGYAPERWVRDPRLWLSRLHPADRQRVLSLLVRAHRQGRDFEAEYRLLDRSGRARWVRDRARVVRDPEGRPLFIQGTWTETTGIKKLEREAAGRGRALETARRELADLVSVASHELKAPLRRISNLGELLAARLPPGDERAALLARVRDSAAVAEELVDGLVRYTEQDPGLAAFSAVDAGAEADRALRELADAASAAGATITRGPLPRVWGEPALLRRIFVHLLENALKFRGLEPPRVHLSARRAGEEWILTVRDNGRGLEPRDSRRLFALGGRGMGLAASRRIVEGFGGRIWVESEPGEGAAFQLALKAADEEGRP